MTESEPRPRAFVPQLIQPGDIVLTTTPARMSRKIRALTGADISHAMVCVAKSSVIDSTGDGVHARNLERIVLEAGCAGHVLRPLTPLTAVQLRTVISWARAAVGTRRGRRSAGQDPADRVRRQGVASRQPFGLSLSKAFLWFDAPKEVPLWDVLTTNGTHPARNSSVTIHNAVAASAAAIV